MAYSVKHKHERKKERDGERKTGLIKAVCASVHQKDIVLSHLVPVLTQ